MAADHFGARGHKKAVLLASNLGYHYYIAFRRFSGFRDRCAELGIELLEIQVSDPDSKSEFRDIRKKIRDFGATAIMVNHPGNAETAMGHLESMDLDFLLYDTVLKGPVDRNVWCVERPIESISEKSMLMLLDEIRRGARGLVSQIRLKPKIREIPKITRNK